MNKRSNFVWVYVIRHQILILKIIITINIHHGLVTCIRGRVRGILMSTIRNYSSFGHLKTFGTIVIPNINVHVGFWGMLDHWNMEIIYWNISNHNFLIFARFISFVFILIFFNFWILYLHVLYLSLNASVVQLNKVYLSTQRSWELTIA